MFFVTLAQTISDISVHYFGHFFILIFTNLLE